MASVSSYEQRASQDGFDDVGSGAGPRLSSLFVQGIELAFRDLTIQLPETKKAAKPPAKILDGVSGVINAGELVFLMGPSGAGKSTLLDTLADRMKLPVSGDILVDGEPRDPKKWARTTKYVEQTDSLYASLTVQEAVDYSARLYDVKNRGMRVRDTLKALGLTDAANTKTGGLFFRGLSGGQKRRLSVAIELVTRPALLLLDEPTSGLDSASAYALVKMLKELCEMHGTTIICSIHQPSKIVFDFADRVMFLARGQVAYFGPTASAASYLETISGQQMPPETNVADWIISLIGSSNAGEVNRITDDWASATSELARSVKQEVLDTFEGDQSADSDRFVLDLPPSWARSTMVLMSRTFKNLLRDPGIFWLRIIMYAFLALFFGLVWFDIGGNNIDVEDQASSVFFIVGFYTFMAVAAAPFYLDEKRQVTRERAAGAYPLSAFFVAHTVTELPFILINAVISSTLVYWMQGLQASFVRYIYFVLVIFLALQFGESLTYLAITVNKYEILALGLNSCANGLFMALGGYLRRRNQIGWWWRWMDYSVNGQFWAFNALMKNEFTDRMLEDATDSFPPRPAMSGEEYLARQGLETSDNIYWIALVAIVAVSLALRLFSLGWAFLTWRTKK
mmetsp:Transcript_18765/g.46090  ORF Transcript_18765/g.46090 Transcript_18765/m.46090 type:complete len:625 (+) Transcript_18765:57-1931(+)